MQISEYSVKSTVSDEQQTENDRQKPDHPFQSYFKATPHKDRLAA